MEFVKAISANIVNYLVNKEQQKTKQNKKHVNLCLGFNHTEK